MENDSEQRTKLHKKSPEESLVQEFSYDLNYCLFYRATCEDGVHVVRRVAAPIPKGNIFVTVIVRNLKDTTQSSKGGHRHTTETEGLSMTHRDVDPPRATSILLPAQARRRTPDVLVGMTNLQNRAAYGAIRSSSCGNQIRCRRGTCTSVSEKSESGRTRSGRAKSHGERHFSEAENIVWGILEESFNSKDKASGGSEPVCGGSISHKSF
ncbi:hypothetical protein IW262DRAFT_1477851 [Armillaria fumosa]|nr:hypothetical protein IW262DRAFT_1477851 [Armillaria fumosa]